MVLALVGGRGRSSTTFQNKGEGEFAAVLVAVAASATKKQS